jgi:hypothetical protein
MTVITGSGRRERKAALTVITESGRRQRKGDNNDGDWPLRLPQMFWNRSSSWHVSSIRSIQL